LAIKQHLISGNTKNILFFEGTLPNELIDINLWDEVKEIEFHGDVRSARRAVNRAHDILSRTIAGSQAEIFISDIAWPLNNRVFFSKAFKNYKFSIISDGIASYVSPNISLRQQIKNIVKLVVGLFGITSQFRPYTGDMMGMTHQRIKSIYSFRSDLLVGLYKSNLYNVEFGYSNINSKNDTCLFLDQPYQNFMSKEVWQEIRGRTIDFLLNCHFNKIYYKSHPMCDESYKADFVPIGAEIIDTRLPIELLFGEIEASTIVSYTSTALFNIKLLAGSDVRAIALFPDLFVKIDGSGGKAKRSLLDVLSGAGVEIIRGHN
jgi:hypothetical protein